MSRRWPLCGALLLFVVLLGALGRVYLRGTDGHVVYAADDAYIGMATAKNVAAHGVWGLTPYAFTGAATSPIWVLALAAAQRLVGLRELTPFILNVTLALGVLVLASDGLARSISGARGRFAALALLVCATPLAGLAFFGMEHALQCLAALGLALSGVRACAAADPGERRRLVHVTAAWAALAIATRYDTASVVTGVLIVLLANEGWAAAGEVAFAAAAPALIYAGFSAFHGWPPVPIAILEKSRAAEFTRSSSSAFAAVLADAAVLRGALALAALMAVSAALLTVRVHVRSEPAREAKLLLVVFLIGAILHVQFGRIGWPFRYEAYLMVLGVVAAASALGALAPRTWIAGLAVVVALTPIAKRTIVLHTLVSGLGRQVYQHEYQQGAFLARYPQPGPVMLVDVGAPSYLSDLRVVDMGGLGSLDVAESLLMPSGPRDLVGQFAALHGVRVAFDFADDRSTPFAIPAEWVRVAVWASPDDSVTFFAADAAAAFSLTRDLRAYAPDLPSWVHLRLFAD